jgi:hypothetical protein
MSYSARTRDLYRGALTAVTGLSTVGAVAASGWLAGAAAHDHSVQMAAQKAEKDQAERKRLEAWYAAHPQVVLKQRPVVTVVQTRTVPAGEVGTGGSLSASGGSTPASSASSAGSSGSGGGSAPAPAPAAPPPPAPAPSGGS